MKHSLAIVTLGLLLFTSKAQQVNYKIQNDEPKNINNFSCNIDLMHFDGGFNQFDGFSINAGVWGHGMFMHRLGVDYTARYGYFTFGRLSDKNLKPNIYLQGGAFLIFHQRSKATSNRVVLKSEDLGYVGGGKTATKVTYIMVPSTAWKYKALRGGIYFKRGIYRIEDDINPDVLGNFYMLGAYGGICFGKGVKLSVQTDNYGVKGFAVHSRICFDALITPIHNAPSGVTKVIPIGGRFLWQTLPAIVRKDARKKYNRRVVVEVEAGYRLADGPYMACSIAIPISRNLNFLGKQEPDKSTQRTTE